MSVSPDGDFQLTFLAKRCPECQRWTFPLYVFKDNGESGCCEYVDLGSGSHVKSRLEKLGILPQVGVYGNDGKMVCSECATGGKVTFTCAECNIRQPILEIQDSFGHPDRAEFLCKTCYGRMTAESWDKKRDELTTEHRYDWE